MPGLADSEGAGQENTAQENTVQENIWRFRDLPKLEPAVEHSGCRIRLDRLAGSCRRCDCDGGRDHACVGGRAS